MTLPPFEAVCFDGPNDGNVMAGRHHVIEWPGGGYYRWQRFGFKRGTEIIFDGGCWVWCPTLTSYLNRSEMVKDILQFLGNLRLA